MTSPNAAAPAIELRDVVHRYGETTALRGLSLTVNEGEVFSLLGHNGAGKTTTVRIINGLLSPASGTVRVFGKSPVTDGVSIRRRTAVLTAQEREDRLYAWHIEQRNGRRPSQQADEGEGRDRTRGCHGDSC